MTVAERLRALGLALPQPMKPPPGAKLPFRIPVEIEAEVLLKG